jgi:hypothetical protein
LPLGPFAPTAERHQVIVIVRFFGACELGHAVSALQLWSPINGICEGIFMKAAQLFGSLLLAITITAGMTACQNATDKKAKSRMGRGPRSKANLNDGQLSVEKMSAKGAPLCTPAKESIEFCHQIFVTLNSEGFIMGLDKDLINQGEGRKITKSEAPVKDDYVNIKIENKPKNKDKKVLLIVAFSTAPEEKAVNAISEAKVDNAEIAQFNISTPAEVKKMQELIQNADPKVQVVVIAVGGRQTMSSVKSALGSRKADVIGYNEMNLDKVGIENFVLSKYVGEKLDLTYKLPYARNQIDVDSLKVQVDSVIVKDEDLKLSGNKNSELVIQIVNRDVFKKYTDPIEISFPLLK